MSSMAPTSVSQRLVWLQSPGVLILALVLGVLFGIFAPHRMLALDVLADAYLNFLQILVVPLILCSIILNIQGMFKERTYTRTSLRAMSGLFLMALLPALLGMVVAQLLNPGAGITTENLWRIEKVLGGQNIDQVSRINLFSDAMDTQASAIDGLINAFLPNNIFLALAQGDEIKIAVFAIMFGFAVSVINSRLKDDFNQSLEAVISACFKISHLCSFALPLVVFIVASQICSQVGSDALVVMAHFLITFLTVTFLLCLISFVILKFRSDASGFGVLSSLLPTLRISLASGEPGTHGAMVMGMQGMGVNTPSAAAVAAITIGLAMDWHMPKGMMFNIGLLSMMLASGTLVITKLVGNTIRVPGATPKLHLSMAPMQT